MQHNSFARGTGIGRHCIGISNAIDCKWAKMAICVLLSDVDICAPGGRVTNVVGTIFRT